MSESSSHVFPQQELALKAPVTQASIERHIFVCTGSSCSSNDSQATLESFWAELSARKLLYGKRGSMDGRIVVSTCGSVGLCAVGPAVLVYPDGVWYYKVTVDDVPEIIEQHILENKPVQRLLALTLADSTL